MSGAPRLLYHFNGWRACHSDDSGRTVCKGFETEHGDDCTPIQLARRVQLVQQTIVN